MTLEERTRWAITMLRMAGYTRWVKDNSDYKPEHGWIVTDDLARGPCLFLKSSDKSVAWIPDWGPASREYGCVPLSEGTPSYLIKFAEYLEANT